MLVADGGGLEGEDALDGVGQSRKEKRKALKKQKRKQARRELAIREREEEEARANDPEEQLCIRLREQEEAEVVERERKAFEERERLWLEAAAACRAEEERKEEEARRERPVEESLENEVKETNEFGEGDDWEYVEEGPAEIIWKGNEIIVKKKRVRVKKGVADKGLLKEADDRPTSNPLPPQSVAFEAFNSLPPASAQEALESVAQQVPNFGTEQDKAHCPFHLKTGACRFGMRCSRVHFYPDKSCTLLIKNMYNGPGIAWEQDEGLEVCMIMPNVADVYTDEEVECCYEEFYEDVHTEFLKFGELINFKACRNSSFHLRGNVYIHYKNLESASLAYNTMNGRYYGGKQITCEFVNITRWKTAICGEYMKSRLKTCSHGTACNFIHCFYNPGGDYEWADWDNPPPRYWVKKMAVLFGPSDGPRQDMDVGLENQPPKESGKKRTRKSDSYHSRRDRYKETVLSGSSGGEVSDGNRDRRRSRGRYSHYERRSYSRERRKAFGFADKLEQSRGGHFPEADRYEYSRDSYDSGNDMLKVNDRGSHKERESMEGSCIEDYEEHARKHKSDSSSRSMRKTTVDRVGKSEKKSKDHGQRKRADLPDSDNVNHKVEDGYKKDGHASNKANYKNVSDADEHHSDRPSSVDLYSEKEISHKKDRRPRSEHRSHRHKHDNETRYKRQDAEVDGSSPVESLDDRTKGATEFRRMRGKYVHRRRSRSPCPSDLDDSGNSGSSGGSSYERKSKRPISKRRRHHRKRDHDAVRGDDGDSASDGMGLESGRSKQHLRWTPGPPI